MAQRRKKGEHPEPPARKEIGTYDLKDYPMGELIVTGDGSIRRAWQLSERVLIVIGGEKHAADAGDFVYELRLPGGSAGALEVLQADVAQGMGYEWKEGREHSSPFPVPGTTTGGSAPAGAREVPPGPPPEGTTDVYHADGRYLSSITTKPEIGKPINLAGRGTFYVHEIDGQAAIVREEPPGQEGAAELTTAAQALANGTPEGEKRTGFDRRQDPPDPDAPVPDPDRRTEAVDRRGEEEVQGDRRDPDLPNGRRDRDPELVDPNYSGEEKRSGSPGRRADDEPDPELEAGPGYDTSDELTDMGPGAVAILESLVRWAKRQTKPWRDLSEKHQERELADLDRVITERVRDLVVDVAAREFPYVHATLEKVEFSEGIKATITIPSHSEHRHELADHAKQTVTIVLAGAASWTADERPKPDPDQPKLV